MLAPALLLGLTGCAGTDTAPPEAIDELSLHEDQPCPGARRARPREGPVADRRGGHVIDRVLFVTAVGADLTRYAVDLFGCEFVRMTDDPYAHPPARATQPGTVPGVLVSEALVQLAR